MPVGAPIHHERHRPEQTTLYRLVQQHAASLIARNGIVRRTSRRVTRYRDADMALRWTAAGLYRGAEVVPQDPWQS